MIVVLSAGLNPVTIPLGAEVELIVQECPRHYPYAGPLRFTVTKSGMAFLFSAEPIPWGAEGNPFQIGDAVFATTNAEGVLTITGTGAMRDFASAAEVPWVAAAVTAVTVGTGVTKIGKNAFAGIDEEVTVNGTALSYHHEIADAMGITAVQSPSGVISPAEFEQVAIIEGKAYLGVSVYTSDTVTNQNWSVATNGVIEVPAEGKQGFFYLMSKPAVPSDSRKPVTADIQRD